MNIKIILIILLATVVILGGGIFLTLPKSPKNPGKYDTFAKCLTEKNLTMYGAYWCAHCKSQKALFGDSFKYVNYVECSTQTKLCLDKGVNGYPTWITSDGQKFEGEQSLKKLSDLTSCPL